VAIQLEGAVVLFEVFDMPTALEFYCDLLGFEVVQAAGVAPNFGWVWLRHGGAELMLNTMYDDGERPETPDLRRRRAHGDTILYLGCRDVDGVYEYVRGRGTSVAKPEVAPYGMKQLYLSDPDGYRICFQWRAS
jgi:glyoxylase I family protein